MILQNEIAPPQPCEQTLLDTHTQLATLRDQLLRYCVFLTGSHHEAEDLVQTTLLKALTVLEGEPPRNVTALLRRIAKNAWIDEVRKQSKYGLCDPEELTVLGGHVVPEEPSELESAIQVLIHRLTKQQTAVLMLSEVFEYKDQEIGELLGISRGAVKAALHRARARLDSMPPDYAELFSVEDEGQKEILQAYL